MNRRRESSRGSNLAVLVLRTVLGGLLAGHGAQKMFGSFNGPGLEGTSGFLETLGLRPGRLWAYLAGVSELGGGVLTVLGFLNPLGPLGVIGSMAMAWATAHRGQPIWVTEGGAELPLTNITAATAVVLSGPGKYSLDRALGTRLPAWTFPLGLVAILLSVIYGVGGEASPPEGEEAREELAGEE